jgi:hypothetical protein
VLVVSPVFDADVPQTGATDLLWELRAVTDARIEPVACGQQQWEQDVDNWLLQTVRQKGVAVI